MSAFAAHAGAKRLLDLLLTTDPKMREPLALQLLCTLLYTCWALLARFLFVPLQLTPAWFGHGLVVHQVLAIVTAYPLLRSGRTLGWSDPYLGIAQTLWAGLALVVGYAVLEPIRPLILQTLCMVQVFGFLSLKPKAARIVGACVVAMLLTMLGVMCWLNPPGFRPVTEGLKIIISSVIIGLLAWQSSRFSQFRELVTQDKQALRAALAEVQRITLMDSLTGLPNRQHLQQRLDVECERMRRTGSPLSVALIDLDHFKQVNDTFGHAAGDDVLAGFAQAAREALRETDIVGRWGGEEFLVLLPGTLPDEAAGKSLERLRQLLDTRELSAAAPGLRARFSAGIACAAVGESQEGLMARADKALYEAKAGGRDRSCVAQPADTEEEPRATPGGMGQ
jgi:diguanylate cyclase (GGDEF)-like protein